jgi:hypothetical protein
MHDKSDRVEVPERNAIDAPLSKIMVAANGSYNSWQDLECVLNGVDQALGAAEKAAREHFAGNGKQAA